MANTSAWAASRPALPVSRTTASTADVTQAAKRGARTSICRDGAVITRDLRTADGARRDGRRNRPSRSDRGSCRRGTDPPCGARSAGCPRREGNGSRAAADAGVHEGGQLLRPGRAAAAADHDTGAVEVEERRGPPDVEGAHLVQMALGV